MPEDRHIDHEENLVWIRSVVGKFVAQDELLYKHPISEQKTLQAIMAEISPAFIYRPRLNDMYGDSVKMKVRVFESPSGALIQVKESDGKVWIDVSSLQPGDGGGAIYAAVGNYVFNAGKIFVDDPEGVSHDAVRRRPIHMLSLALKFGTTNFLAVSQNFEHTCRRYGEPELNWTEDASQNLQILIRRSIDPIYKAMPFLRSIHYDFRRSNFTDDLGHDLPTSWSSRLARSGAARNARVGESTIRRAVFLQSVASSPRETTSRLFQEPGADGSLADRVSLTPLHELF
jgi:hypothetical protein